MREYLDAANIGKRGACHMFRRLIRIAQGDSGQCRIVADSLLAWWNAAAYGGFDLTDLWAVDAAIAEDMLTVFAELRHCRRYPDDLGYGRQFQVIVHRWRPGLNDTLATDF